MSTLPLFDRSVILAAAPPKMRPYQSKAIQRMRDLVREGKRRVILVSPTGCHAKGQLVLMFNGDLRAVEDVRAGDLLMGPDSEPRVVLELRRGQGRMYRIKPLRGDPWVVNEDHVLTLVRTNADNQPERDGELVDVTVREWLDWNNWRKHIHYLFRVGVRFNQTNQLPITPYLLGVWLGDGWIDNTQCLIAVGGDSDLERAVLQEAVKNSVNASVDSYRGESNRICHLTGTGTGVGRNHVRNWIRSLGLFEARSHSKFIPQIYKTSSYEDRLEILAGLMDTDGSLSIGSYDFISKSHQLANDTAFLARSVGLSATVYESVKGCQTVAVGTYWRVCIGGKTDIIPCRVPRKRAPHRDKSRDSLRVGFDVEPVGEDLFYGFTLDRDGRYLIDDFTVTHNSGKMTVAASMIQTSSVPALFVAHRLELIDDCVNRLAYFGISNVGVIRGDDDRTNPDAAVQVASIQTLARRKKPRVGLVLIDECHRAMSDTYSDLLEHYASQTYNDQPVIVIGFTATPTRYDGKPLGNAFDHLEIVTTYHELMKQGFIVGPECYGAPEGPDLAGVRVIGGDYDNDALGEVMRKQNLIGNLLDHWLKLADKYPRPDGGIGLVEGPRRRTFVFATTIQHSLDICDRFSKAGIKIAHLDGTTPEAERRRTTRALGDGELEAISNCNVLLEGVDIPSAKCVAHARPTQSLVLWRQSCGRILRPWHPGCPPGCVAHPSLAPLLLDHANNIARHGYPHEDLHWTLTERARRLEKKIPIRICRSCYAYLPAGRMLCPYCGAEAPPPEASEPPEETNAKLVRHSTTPEDMQRKFYDDMVNAARKKGHKPGFAAAKFKEHYGGWPPWAWSEATRASFASDPEWQAALEGKQARIEKRKAAEKAAEEALAAAPEEIEVPPDDANENPVEDGEAPFDEWLGKEGLK